MTWNLNEFLEAVYLEASMLAWVVRGADGTALRCGSRKIWLEGVPIVERVEADTD